MEDIKILIVDDNQGSAQNLAKLIQFESDLEVVGIVGTAAEAQQAIPEFHPQVILMDVGLPDGDGYATTITLHELDPLLQVILYRMDAEAHHFRKAMRAGAVDLLRMPVNGDTLTSAIREAVEKQEKKKIHTGRLIPPPELVSVMPRPPGRLIAIYSGKGGVGCTTIATNLALALHSDETPCVLIDADLQYGDVLAFLNLKARFTVSDIAYQHEGLDEALIRETLLSHASGLSVLAAPLRPEMADEIQVDVFLKILEHLRGLFAYIVVDTACRLDDLTITILEAADLILHPLVPDIPSIKNTRLFLETLAQLGLASEKVLLVLNQVDKSDPIRAENVASNLHHEVAVELPMDYKSVRASINRGEPLLKDRKTHPLTKPLLDLVLMVREHLAVVVEE